MASVPSLSETRKRFYQIPDHVPSPMNKPTGCFFHPRCDRCTQACKEKMPPLEHLPDGRAIRCFHPSDGEKNQGEA